ncbi:MAG: RlmE family RNA methyltransferase [Desulfovibrionaceae bacterium]|nr:RlmE family RNA methyltransferase [Desulfovibrionaceae bacterium]
MKTYRDHYFLKAKREKYPARSVYKLKEMDARFRLLKPGMTVLDLGAAPGSWSLYAAERVGSGGRVLACDLQATGTVFPSSVTFVQENVFERTPGFEALLDATGPFDLVMSDMAPRTTGTKFTDQARSLELCLEAVAVADRWLRPGGHFVTKIFMGPDFQDLARALRQRFDSVKTFKPNSSRAESKEIFELGLGFKSAPARGDNRSEA